MLAKTIFLAGGRGGGLQNDVALATVRQLHAAIEVLNFLMDTTAADRRSRMVLQVESTF